MIPMVDLKIQYHQLKSEIDAALFEVLQNTAFILGPNVRSFEEETAAYLDVKYTVGCASGTDALHLALRASGIGPGDEVITTAFTFIATAEAIRYVGATPVFVDINNDTYNIDPAAAEAAITEKTRAIIPVHLFGQPADMAALQKIADQHKLQVIEDCAQSFGARLNENQTGSFGVAGCFSFFPSKNLGCFGDGGLISTNSKQIRDHLLSLRNHGSSQRYHHREIGYNSRLDEMQAAILRIKLQHIDEFNRGRRRVAQHYNQLLADCEVTRPYEDGLGTHVFHQYTLRSNKREQIMQALQDKQIGCAVYYPIALHQQEVFATECKNTRLPITEALTADCFSLPIFPEMTDKQIVTVTDIIKQSI